jgi:hypothetical protein
MKQETFDQYESRLETLNEMHEINLKIIEKITEHENRIEALRQQEDINQKLIKRNNLNPLFQGLFDTTFPNIK